MNSLPPEVTRTELAPGYPALQIESSLCSATVALHGAHLTHWQPAHTSRPVLYTSPTAVFREGTAIRGGIPLCWPWFAAHPTEPAERPFHGIARNRFWALQSATVVEGVVTLVLTLPSDPEVEAQVPFSHEVQCLLTLGRQCRVELISTNCAPHNVTFGGALHTYLALSDISQVHVAGLQNTRYLDTTFQPNPERLQTEEHLHFAAETDRIYQGTSLATTLQDPEWNRAITVSKGGSLTTVVWNPWLAKAQSIGDLPDEAFHDFLCIEATNARHDARVVPPGGSHTLMTKIAVSSSE